MPIPFTCPHCGHSTLVADQYAGQSGPCAGCGRTIVVPAVAAPGGPPAEQPWFGEDPVVRMVLPVGRSGWAIAAGYAGLFSLLCLPAPIALVFGLLAIRDLRRYPEKHGMGRAVFGLVMGGLGTVALVVALAGLLVRAVTGH